ncbi:hypothetical protein FACS1894204_12190 [Synergistales bacterium]|nr:hypothetical protein FACS1894204_12190 [Synergistales bacterium]
MILESLGISIAVGVYNSIKADGMNERALKKLGEAYNRQVEAKHELQKQSEKIEKSLEKLASRKKGILTTSISDFITLYEKIGKIDFDESERIARFSSESQLSASVGEMRRIVVASQALTGKQMFNTFLVSGVVGGLLSGGVGFLTFAVTGLIKKEAELNLSNARMINRQSQVIASQAESAVVTLDAIYQASERFAKVLAQLNLLFCKAMKTTSVIIEKNGGSRLNYSKQDKDYIRTLINTADALIKIIDAPLFEEDGAISNKVGEVMETGQQYIEEIGHVIEG